MWKVVNLAAISVSADLVELWFLGDLLGIFWTSELFFFFLYSLGLGVFGALLLFLGLAALGVLEGRRYC